MSAIIGLFGREKSRIAHAPAMNPQPPKLPARVNNISRGGINLEVPQRFAVGNLLCVNLSAPEDESDSQVLAHVVHSRPVSNQRWSIGCMWAVELEEGDLLSVGANRQLAGSSDQRTWARFEVTREITYQRASPASSFCHSVIKRGCDIVLSLLGLVMLAPLLAVVAVLIKLTDRGPILYWHSRVGRWGNHFWFPKFRSMIVQADKTRLREQLAGLNHHKEGPTFKMKVDPRVTWIGRIIRRCSIDELPQLWSVLRGHMSLVGPRPALPREVAQYSLHDRRRLEVMPGLTCLWQVRGRGDLPFALQVELDIEYIENQSLWMDFKIMLLTIPAVVSGKGAY
jgi:lipopolysaccharide/colanic/teichoic acid biosynthesis glycosyltransferase